METAIRDVSGYTGIKAITRSNVISLDDVFDRYALMNANDWASTKRLKMTDDRLSQEEKEYLNLTDDLVRVAKIDNFKLLQPGPLVSNYKYKIEKHRPKSP